MDGQFSFFQMVTFRLAHIKTLVLTTQPVVMVEAGGAVEKQTIKRRILRGGTKHGRF
jgi:hypothetical protein